MRIECEHIESKAKGICIQEIKGNEKFPDQYGIYWTKKANCLGYANHYYWNDKSKIILKELK